MNESTYKPETWISFKQGTGGGFGKIVGGMHTGKEWIYHVEGATSDKSLRAIPEGAILSTLQNGSWIAPTHFSGTGSAYTEQQPGA